eukprot:SAG31_NODE_3812_length_3860_cov_1.918107_4_plen_165_part_00
MSWAQVRTVPFETAMQNGTLAIAVILAGFNGEAQKQAIIGPGYYLTCQATLVVYLGFFRWANGYPVCGDPGAADGCSSNPCAPCCDEDFDEYAYDAYLPAELQHAKLRRESFTGPTVPMPFAQSARILPPEKTGVGWNIGTPSKFTGQVLRESIPYEPIPYGKR